MKRKFSKRTNIVIVVILTLALAGGLYTMEYNVPGNDEAFVKAAKQYMEEGFFVPLGITKIKNTAFVFYKGREQISASNGYGPVRVGGFVQFKRGWNGLWAPIQGTESINNVVLRTEAFSDNGYITAKDYSLIYGFDLPERAARFELDYYDIEIHEETEQWELSTCTGTVEDGVIFETVPASIGYNNHHAERIYDRDGNEIPKEELEKRVNGSSSARGSMEMGLLDAMCIIILLLGAALVNRIRKEEPADELPADEAAKSEAPQTIE